MQGTSNGRNPANDGRRRFVRRAAVVAGAAWVAPTVISVPPAGAAELTSPPPEVTPTSVRRTPGSPEVPVGQEPGATDGGAAAGPAGVSGSERTALPRTGLDLEGPLTVGTGLAAGGAALKLWSTKHLRPQVADGSERPAPKP